ncbi:MAG: MFS transporter [Gracilibacteraceae bacterium]|nr:MFS transporter [Gracilibacteraceae bacterium]
MNDATTGDTAKTGYAWVVMAGCCLLVFGTLGTVGGTAAVFLYPISVDLDVPISTLSLYLSISAIVMAFLGPMAGKLFEKIKPRYVMALASVVLGGGCALYGLCAQLWHFYAVAVVVAAGSSVLYFIAVPTMITMWFRERTAFAMSVALAFSGIGSMIMNVIVGRIIDTGGWRTGFFAVGLICVVLCVPVTLLLLKTPQEKNLLPYGAAPEATTENAKSAQPSGAPRGLTMKQALATPAFFLMFIGQFCFSITTASNQLLATFGRVDLAMDAVGAGLIVSCCAAGLIAGKIFLGATTDKFGVNQANITGTTITCAGLILLSLTSGTTFVYAAAVVFGLGLGVYNIEPPIYVRRAFGIKAYGAIFGAVSIATTLGSSIFMPVYNAIAANLGGYGATFYISCATTALACVLYITADRLGKNYISKYDAV